MPGRQPFHLPFLAGMAQSVEQWSERDLISHLFTDYDKSGRPTKNYTATLDLYAVVRLRKLEKLVRGCSFIHYFTIGCFGYLTTPFLYTAILCHKLTHFLYCFRMNRRRFYTRKYC